MPRARSRPSTSRRHPVRRRASARLASSSSELMSVAVTAFSAAELARSHVGEEDFARERAIRRFWRTGPPRVMCIRQPYASRSRHDRWTDKEQAMTAADLGQLIRTDNRATLAYRRRLAHPPERVWEALTEPDELAAWFPTTIDGERGAGAPLTFRFEHVELEPMRRRDAALRASVAARVHMGIRSASVFARARWRRDRDDLHGGARRARQGDSRRRRLASEPGGARPRAGGRADARLRLCALARVARRLRRALRPRCLCAGAPTGVGGRVRQGVPSPISSPAH